jgi:hypothetical protein
LVILHVAFSFVAGWLTDTSGGSIDRAPFALAVMFATLGAGGVCAATIYGIRRRPSLMRADAVVSLVTFYGSSWILTTAHSPIGDVAVVLLACIPIALGAASGYSIGQLAGRVVGQIQRPLPRGNDIGLTDKMR